MPDRTTDWDITRRSLLEVAASGAAIAEMPKKAMAQGNAPVVALAAMPTVQVRLQVNSHDHTLALDPRTTLLDALRDHIGLTGTKKGCDHGQCGACTVIVDGRRINSCLTLAVMHEGDAVTTPQNLLHTSVPTLPTMLQPGP